MIRLTRVGGWFLAAVVLLYLASLTSQSPLLLLLIGVLGGCYGVNGVAAWRAVRHLAVEAPPTVYLAEGGRLSQPWRIINHGTHAASLVRVEAAQGAAFGIGRLGGKAETCVAPEMVYWRRGVYSHSSVRVSSVALFGLIRASRRLHLAGEVVVYPALFETPAPRAAGFDVVVGGKLRGRRRSASGVEFAGVRPIQPGDALRQIHWKSSAKGLGLMVKTFDEELSGRAAVIMDSGHTGDTKAFDDCARAAGSLVFAALNAGYQVEWIDLACCRVVPVSPFSDGQEILDRLARMTPVPGCVTADRLRACVERVSRKSALSLVLTAFPPAVAAAVGQLRGENRLVSLYLPASAAASAAQAGACVFAYDERAVEPRG